MTVKTEVSRFHIHDELTAPDQSAPILKSIQVGGRQVNKLVGVLAGSPAVLRAYTRMRAELQQGSLPKATRHRVALAVAEHRGDSYSVVQYAKSARAAGLGLDEVSRARSFTSADEHENALLIYLKAALDAEGDPPLYLPRRGTRGRVGRRADSRSARPCRSGRVPEPDGSLRSTAQGSGDAPGSACCRLTGAPPHPVPPPA